MNESKIIEANNILFFLASVFIFNGLLAMAEGSEPSDLAKEFHSKEVIQAPIVNDEKFINPYISQAEAIRDYLFTMPMTITIPHYEYLGEYFITAYSDEETWSRMTASGEEVHYHDEWYVPSSCAIDRRYHSFYEVLLVGDPEDPDNRRTYISEDTGSAVLGHHIDCFVETMEEVNSFQTRWDSVWAVSYETKTISAKERRQTNEWLNDYLHHRSIGIGIPYRCDS